MKKIIKIQIDVKNDTHNITKADVVKLQDIFKGNISQIIYTQNLCENCESKNAGADYCADCKNNNFNLFAIKEE